MPSQDTQGRKKYPVNEWIFRKAFHRHPFFTAIMRKMERDFSAAGFDKSAVSRLDHMVRVVEGLKKNEPIRMTEKSRRFLDAMQKYLSAKGATMLKEEYLERISDPRH